MTLIMDNYIFLPLKLRKQRGINIGGAQHKMSLYTDDVLLYLLEPVTSVSQFIAIIRLFGSFFGYKISF